MGERRSSVSVEGALSTEDAMGRSLDRRQVWIGDARRRVPKNSNFGRGYLTADPDSLAASASSSARDDVRVLFMIR